MDRRTRITRHRPSQNTCRVIISDQQKDLPLSKLAIRALVRGVLDQENIRCDEVHVNFVTEKKIGLLHEQFFGDDSPTDCITLPIDQDEEGEVYRLLGEIFVCPKTALVYTEKRGNPWQETARYVIHSILHLIGYEDLDEKSRAVMKRRENRLLTLLLPQLAPIKYK